MKGALPAENAVTFVMFTSHVSSVNAHGKANIDAGLGAMLSELSVVVPAFNEGKMSHQW
jgi:hypothetical protein